VFDAKFNGFRSAAASVRDQLISCNGNRMKRFEKGLDLLPTGLVPNGKIVVLDGAARFLFGHRRPIYVAFDLWQSL